MSLAESIKLALTSLRSNKMRALLTLLGVIIGISSVIAIVTLGNALQAQTLQNLADAGINDLTAQVKSRTTNEEEEEDENSYGTSPVEVDQSSKISADMVSDLKRRFPGQIAGVGIGSAAQYQGTISTPAQVGTKNITLNAVNTDFITMKKLKPAVGRLLTEEDIEGDRQVTVISPKAVQQLFHGNNNAALGAEVDFTNTDGRNTSFVVVGVYEETASKGGLVNFGDESIMYVPWPSESRFANADGAWNSVSIRPAPGTDDGQVKQKVQEFFDQQYENDVYYRVAMKDAKKELANFNQQLSTVSMFVSAIGGISLLVGGIGVMNIMLVTVTERTREIGVRKALGATRNAIRIQFVVEAMIVGLLGGIIGVILGGAIGMIGSAMMGAFVYPPISGVLIALFFSLGIGLFFGYYPANKAAKLNPIDALRYE